MSGLISNLSTMTKTAGGPGSGVTGNNTKEIEGIERSEYISLHTRKEFMETHESKEERVPMNLIKKVSQDKYVPSKMRKMRKNWNEVKNIPVALLKVSDTEYHVIDGHHRFLIAKDKGLTSIVANVYELKDEDKVKVAADATKSTLKDTMEETTQAEGLEKLTGNKLEASKVPDTTSKSYTDFADWAKSQKRAGVLGELMEESLEKAAGINWSKKFKDMLDRKGDSCITFIATGDAPKVVTMFLRGLRDAKKIGVLFGNGEDENIELEWSKGEARFVSMEINYNGAGKYFMIYPSEDQFEELSKIFSAITRVNLGTGGAFTVDGKDDKMWLDGDGVDHINELNINGKKIKTANEESEYVKNFEKNILVDFDDVIHDLSHDKYNHNKISGSPVEGAKEHLGKLIKHGFKILILSARSSCDFEDLTKELMEDWLDENDIPYTEVVDKKHPAFAMVDDRVIPFFGDWESTFQALTTFKPVQKQEGEDKLLMHTKWLQLRMIQDKKNGVDGYIYAHEVSCGGQKVAILPYKRQGRDGWKVLLRNEVTPAWGMKPVLSSITGGVEIGEKPRAAAVRELKEETGYNVSEKEMRYVGKCFGTKMTDSEYHLFVVDITGKEKGKAEGDGTKLEAKARNKFWAWDSYNSPDPLVHTLVHYMNKSDIEDKPEPTELMKSIGYKEDPFEGIESFVERNKDEIIEALSDNAHRQWSSWAKPMMQQEDLSKKRTDRWEKLFVPYEDLPESEKDKDRVEAKLVIKKFLEAVKDIKESDEKTAEITNIDPHDSKFTSFNKTESVPGNMARAGLAGALFSGILGAGTAHFLDRDILDYAGKSALIGGLANAGVTGAATHMSNDRGGRRFVVDKNTGNVYEYRLNINE